MRKRWPGSGCLRPGIACARTTLPPGGGGVRRRFMAARMWRASSRGSDCSAAAAADVLSSALSSLYLPSTHISRLGATRRADFSGQRGTHRAPRERSARAPEIVRAIGLLLLRFQAAAKLHVASRTRVPARLSRGRLADRSARVHRAASERSCSQARRDASQARATRHPGQDVCSAGLLWATRDRTRFAPPMPTRLGSFSEPYVGRPCREIAAAHALALMPCWLALADAVLAPARTRTLQHCQLPPARFRRMSVALRAGTIPRGGFLSTSRRPSQPRAVRAPRCMAAAVPEGHPRRTSDWLELDGKVALITGGASGLGSACATELARHGVKCVAVADVQRRHLVRCSGAADATGGAGLPSQTCEASWRAGSRRTRLPRKRRRRWNLRTRPTSACRASPSMWNATSPAARA